MSCGDVFLPCARRETILFDVGMTFVIFGVILPFVFDFTVRFTHNSANRAEPSIEVHAY